MDNEEVMILEGRLDTQGNYSNYKVTSLESNYYVFKRFNKNYYIL